MPKTNMPAYESNIGYSQKKIGGKLVITTKPITFTRIGNENTGYIVFTFEDNDPIGNYLVDIYVNNVIEKKVTFNVK
jgi:hypothetical protein